MKTLVPRLISMALAITVIGPSAMLAQRPKDAAPFPGAEVKQRLENERVAIWDVTLRKEQRTEIYELPMDQVSVSLTDAPIKVIRPDKTWTIEQRRLGSVQLDSKGTAYAEEGVGENPSRTIVVGLKPSASPKPEVKEGIPGQFPRAGSTKLFENDRIVVWDHTWRPGVPRREHLHYTQVVGVFIEPGATRSYASSSAAPVESIRKLGDVNFSSFLKSPHSEEVAEGLPRAIFIELK